MIKKNIQPNNTMNFYSLILIAGMLIISITGCNSSDTADVEAAGQESNDENTITITKAQFETSGMKTGRPDSAIFREMIQANGFVVAAPAGKAKVTVLVEGKVTGIYFKMGDWVKKGKRLFTITGNEIIQLQNDYAEAENALSLLKQNYERQKLLSQENINAKKTLQEAENEMKSMEIRAKAFKSKLALLGINTSQVRDGHIYNEVVVTAPLSGYVTHQDIGIGELIETNHVTAEIVDPASLQVELYVYPSDLAELKIGQQVRFFLPDSRNNVYFAELSRIGKSVNPEKRNIMCIAAINQSQLDRFVDGNFIEANIVTAEKKALALPASAVEKVDGEYYIYVKSAESNDAYTFQRTKVSVGFIEADEVEVTTPITNEILIEGVYYVSE